MGAPQAPAANDSDSPDASVSTDGDPLPTAGRRGRFARDITGDAANALDARVVGDPAACREAWLAVESARGANQRLGDPFAALVSGSTHWHLTSNAFGDAIDVLPAAYQESVLECPAVEDGDSCAPVTCDVPVAWQGVAVGLGVTIDPILTLSNTVVGTGVSKTGLKTIGGIHVRYAAANPQDPFDILIA